MVATNKCQEAQLLLDYAICQTVTLNSAAVSKEMWSVMMLLHPAWHACQQWA